MSNRNPKPKGKSSRQTPKRTDQQQPNAAGIGQANKSKIEKIKQITTWAVDEDILAVLRECNGDVTLAVEKILSGDAGRPGEEWTEVSRKKPKEPPNTAAVADGGDAGSTPKPKQGGKGGSTRAKANGENIRVKEARRRSEPRSSAQSGRRGGERQPGKRASGTEARPGSGGPRPRPTGPAAAAQAGRGAPQGRPAQTQQPPTQAVRRIPPEGLARGPGGLSQAAHLAQLQAQAHPQTAASPAAQEPKAEPQQQQGAAAPAAKMDGLLPQPQAGLAAQQQQQQAKTTPQQQQAPAQPQTQTQTQPSTQAAQPQPQPQSPKAHTPKSGSRRGGEQRVWMPRDSAGAAPVRTPPAQARTSQAEQSAIAAPISSITGPIPLESAQQRAVVILPDDEYDPERDERVFAWQFGNFAIKENGAEAPSQQQQAGRQAGGAATAVARPTMAQKEVETPVATAPVAAPSSSAPQASSAPVPTPSAASSQTSAPSSSSPPSRATPAAAAAAPRAEDKKPSQPSAPMQQRNVHAPPPAAAQMPPAMDAEQHMAMGHQTSGYYTGHFAHPSFHPAMSPSGFPLDIDPSQMSFYDPSQYQSPGAYRPGSPQHMGSESAKYGAMQGSQGSGYRDKFSQSQQASGQDRQDDASPSARGQQPQSQSPPPAHQQPHLYAMQTSQYPQPMYGYPPYMGYPAASSQFPPFPQRFPMHYKYTNSAGYPISPPGSASLSSGGYPDEQDYAKYVSQPHVPSFFGVPEATAPTHMGKTHTPPTSSGAAATHPGGSKSQSVFPSSGASNGSDPYKGQQQQQDYGSSQQYYKYNTQAAYNQQYGQAAYQGGQFGFMPQHHMMQTQQQSQGQQNPSGSQGAYS